MKDIYLLCDFLPNILKYWCLNCYFLLKEKYVLWFHSPIFLLRSCLNTEAQTESTITQGYLQPVKCNRHVILHVKGIFINVTGKCYLVLFHYLHFKTWAPCSFQGKTYRSVFISLLAYATTMQGHVVWQLRTDLLVNCWLKFWSIILLYIRQTRDFEVYGPQNIVLWVELLTLKWWCQHN